MVAQEDGSHPSTAERVQALQRQLQTWEARPSLARGAKVVRGPCPALDALFPAGGALRGTLVEWFSRGPGSGAAVLALMLGCQACQEGGLLVVVDPRGWFYPPALAGWRFPWQHLLVVRPPDRRTQLWAVDQALRCPAVAAVWTDLGRIAGRDSRRLQLAAQQGGTLGLLLRLGTGRGQPSWSDVRLAVSAIPSSASWEVEVERLAGRGARGPDRARLEVDTATGTLRALAGGVPIHGALAHGAPIHGALAGGVPRPASPGPAPGARAPAGDPLPFSAPPSVSDLAPWGAGRLQRRSAS